MIRALRRGEVEQTYAIYRDAVRIGAAPFYTEAQRQAWVPSDRMEDWWPDRVLGATTWVDEGETGLNGFLTYADGHLDLFFVRPEARRGTTAPALYDRMLAEAGAEGRHRLTTHASHLARRFLERRGWSVVAREETERNGVLLERFAMELTLRP